MTTTIINDNEQDSIIPKSGELLKKVDDLSRELKIDGKDLEQFKERISNSLSNSQDADEMKDMAKSAGKLALNGASALFAMDPTMMALSFILNFILENAVSNLSDIKSDKEQKEQEDLEKFEKLFNKIFSKENFEKFAENADKLFNYLFKKDDKIDEKAIDKFVDFFEKIKIDDDKKDNAIRFLSIISEKFREEGHDNFSEKFSKLPGKIGLDRDLSKKFATGELEFLSVSFSSTEFRNQTQTKRQDGFVSMVARQRSDGLVSQQIR